MVHNFVYPVVENASEMVPLSKSGASKSRPRWAAHARIGNVWEYPPPSPGGYYSRPNAYTKILRDLQVPYTVHIMTTCLCSVFL